MKTDKIGKAIDEIYLKKLVALEALCEFYAAKCLADFNLLQRHNIFWTNQTYQAMNTVFSGTMENKTEIGWYLAHHMEYGVYLELANDGKYEAIKPLMNSLTPDFIKDVNKIYGAK